jgi:hypothetical protein
MQLCRMLIRLLANLVRLQTFHDQDEGAWPQARDTLTAWDAILRMFLD